MPASLLSDLTTVYACTVRLYAIVKYVVVLSVLLSRGVITRVLCALPIGRSPDLRTLVPYAVEFQHAQFDNVPLMNSHESVPILESFDDLPCCKC
jgi:hypothetical protein